MFGMFERVVYTSEPSKKKQSRQNCIDFWAQLSTCLFPFWAAVQWTRQ
jgi:hypothetical protein